jgi:hypothetical protein
MLLSGCLQLEPGLSGRDAELSRTGSATPAEAAPGGAFRIVEAGPARAVVSARGRRVTIAPVEGLCLAGDALDTSGAGAFAVIAECVAEGRAEGEALPPGFAGLVTVSVSGEPMFGEGGRERALRRLRDFLGTVPGLALLGRNGSGRTVEMVESRRIGDSLYVHVHDRHQGELALLAPDFWRAFVEIEGRLVLVTVSGFRDRPLPEDEMLAVLAAQVARLREANGMAPEAAERALARGAGAVLVPVARRAEGTRPAAGDPALRAADASEPTGTPPPRRRPAASAGARPAPAVAPRAPARPAQG